MQVVSRLIPQAPRVRVLIQVVCSASTEKPIMGIKKYNHTMSSGLVKTWVRTVWRFPIYPITAYISLDSSMGDISRPSAIFTEYSTAL